MEMVRSPPGADTVVMWAADEDCHQPSKVKADRNRFSPHPSKVSMALLMLRFSQSVQDLSLLYPTPGENAIHEATKHVMLSTSSHWKLIPEPRVCPVL